MQTIRIHCDNLICVTAFKDFQGCRNPVINEIIKKLLDWQRTHRVLIEIVYVPTAQNHADLPSREITHEELSITNRFLRFESLKIVKSVLYSHDFRVVEKVSGFEVTLDGASHRGVRLNNARGRPLPYCSRFNDGDNTYQNFLSLNFSNLIDEIVWLFCPKSHESKFLNYFLSFPRRPRLIFMLLQHNELDNLYPLLLLHHEAHYRFQNDNFITRSVKNRTARQPHPFRGVIHIFVLPPKL